MVGIIEFLRELEILIPVIRTIITLAIVFTIFKFILRSIKKNLLKRAKTKKQISNVKIFYNVIQYAVILLLVVFGIFTFVGSWTGLGIGLGLMSAAVGFALQKPITGVAAWLLIITKRPFEIGDRVILGGVKGDVANVTLSHIYLNEIGGMVDSEETSGRLIMVPNAVVFEQNITNYTSQDEFVLSQVPFAITYESSVDQAMKIALDAAKKVLKEFKDKVKEKPFARASFNESGIDIKLRFMVPANQLQKVKSDLTSLIYQGVNNTKGVEFAYPHRHIIMKKK